MSPCNTYPQGDGGYLLEIWNDDFKDRDWNVDPEFEKAMYRYFKFPKTFKVKGKMKDFPVGEIKI